jgi:16S rRNA (guanine(527)-N(7))-methyltransferase RsmG
MVPSRSTLQAMIEGCGIRLTPVQYDRLWTYHGLLRSANTELNLTRIHNFENMVLKHYVDSLLILEFTELPSPLIDMGSGPGLPGIPLKIARPDIRMILAEPRGARAEFLRTVCERLGLEGVEVFANKIGSRFPYKVAGVITRAVASIPETLERVAGCLEPGGRMLFMKGPDCDEEIREAGRTQTDWFHLTEDHAYQIPGTSHARRLVIYERTPAPAPAHTVDATPAFSGPVREVSSASNPMFKLCRDLLTGRGIRKHKQAIMAGSRIVSEIITHFPQHVAAWVTDSSGPHPPTELAPGTPWLRVADALFQELDASGTHSPLLLVMVPPIPAWSDATTWPKGCTLFVPFQDPENVGAVIRSAAAFGVARVVLLRESAHPFHPKAARAAGPALFQIIIEHGPSIRDLAAGRVPLIALSTDGDIMADSEFPETFGLVSGVEGPGLPESLRGGLRRRIPIEPGVESLNAATATAIALYEWRRAMENK